MLFFPFHVGDWITGTKLMSAVEKGVYMDLLTYYYSVERPITEDECKRIARAYAGAEQDAMQYVLQTHFDHIDGAYVHKKCEEVIRSTKEKQNDIRVKKQKAAKARWDKARQAVSADSNDEQKNARAYAGAEQVDSRCNADAMLTNNHKPITNISTNKKEKVEKEKKPQLVRGSSFSLTEIPDDWIQAAEAIDPDIDPQKAFDDFADYWRGVPGEKGRKKDWLATWRNAIRSCPEWKRQRLLKNSHANKPTPSGEPWDDPDYYGESGALI